MRRVRTSHSVSGPLALFILLGEEAAGTQKVLAALPAAAALFYSVSYAIAVLLFRKSAGKSANVMRKLQSVALEPMVKKKEEGEEEEKLQMIKQTTCT